MNDAEIALFDCLNIILFTFAIATILAACISGYRCKKALDKERADHQLTKLELRMEKEAHAAYREQVEREKREMDQHLFTFCTSTGPVTEPTTEPITEPLTEPLVPTHPLVFQENRLEKLFSEISNVCFGLRKILDSPGVSEELQRLLTDHLEHLGDLSSEACQRIDRKEYSEPEFLNKMDNGVQAGRALLDMLTISR